MLYSVLYVTFALAVCGGATMRRPLPVPAVLSAVSSFRTGRVRRPRAMSGGLTSVEMQNDLSSKLFENMINEMQEELGSAQTHLTRFAKIFEEAGGHQEQVARDSPAVESLKVRPVSPVSHLVSRSSGCSKCVYQQVEKDIEAAREAHTENDDFDDWDLGVHRDVALKNEHALYHPAPVPLAAGGVPHFSEGFNPELD